MSPLEKNRCRFAYGHRGWLSTATYPNLARQLSFTHDSAGNVVTMSLAVTGGSSVSHIYTYDSLNRVSQYFDPNGNRFDYTHDAVGQVRKVEIRAKLDSSLTLIATGRIDYDGSGRMLKVEYRKGSSGSMLSKIAYTYDAAGNRTVKKSISAQANYSYNSLNELLTDANTGDIRGNQTFVYDHAGNRSSQTFYGSSALTYDLSNALNKLEGYNGITFDYDAEDNRTKRTVPSGHEDTGDTQYYFDGKQRLRKVTLPDGTLIMYGYDYTNHRVSKTVTKSGAITESRTYLYNGNQLMEETLNGRRQALYGWGPGGLASRTDGDGHTLFYLKDGLGSVMAIIDEKASVVQSYEYSAFGECLSGKDNVNAFRFVGAYGGMQDDDTGLVYFWNRWYEPQTGRWMSEDPIRQVGGVNVYGYVSNNPTLNKDPNGKYTWFEVSLALIIVYEAYQKIKGACDCIRSLSALQTKVNQMAATSSIVTYDPVTGDPTGQQDPLAQVFTTPEWTDTKSKCADFLVKLYIQAPNGLPLPLPGEGGSKPKAKPPIFKD